MAQRCGLHLAHRAARGAHRVGLHLAGHRQQAGGRRFLAQMAVGRQALAVVQVGKRAGAGLALLVGLVHRHALAVGGHRQAARHTLARRLRRALVALANHLRVGAAAKGVKFALRLHLHHQGVGACAVYRHAQPAVAQQHRGHRHLLAVVDVLGPRPQVVSRAAAQLRVGKRDLQIAHLALGFLAREEPLAHLARRHVHQSARRTQDQVPQVIAHHRLARRAAQPAVDVGQQVGIPVPRPGQGRRVQLLHAVHRLQAQPAFKVRLHQVVRLLNAALRPGVPGRVRLVLHVQGVQQVLDRVARVGASLVPQQQLRHAVVQAPLLLAPRPHQEVEQHRLVLALGLVVAHVDHARGVVVAHIPPALELHLGVGVELVLVELALGHQVLFAARRVVQQAQAGVDLVHMVRVQAAQLGRRARRGDRLHVHAALAQQAADLALAHVHRDAVRVRHVHGHGQRHGALAVGANALALHRGNRLQRLARQAGLPRVAALLAAAVIARVGCQPAIHRAGALAHGGGVRLHHGTALAVRCRVQPVAQVHQRGQLVRRQFGGACHARPRSVGSGQSSSKAPRVGRKVDSIASNSSRRAATCCCMSLARARSAWS